MARDMNGRRSSRSMKLVDCSLTTKSQSSPSSPIANITMFNGGTVPWGSKAYSLTFGATAAGKSPSFSWTSIQILTSPYVVKEERTWRPDPQLMNALPSILYQSWRHSLSLCTYRRQWELLRKCCPKPRLMARSEPRMVVAVPWLIIVESNKEANSRLI